MGLKRIDRIHIPSGILPQQIIHIIGSEPDLDTENSCSGVCPCANICARNGTTLGSSNCQQAWKSIDETARGHEQAFTVNLRPLKPRRNRLR